MEQLEKLMGWIETLATKLGTSVEALAPHAFAYTRWRGVALLVMAAFVMGAAAWFCLAGRNAWSWARSEAGKKWSKFGDGDVVPPEIGSILLQLVALGLAMAAGSLFLRGFPSVVEPVGATIHAILAK